MTRDGLRPTATVVVIALALLSSSERAAAQTQPETIPTVVAQAMTFEPMLLGKPQYFNARTPTDWPSALVPPGATIIGGGIIGDSTMFRVETAVFAFRPQTNVGDAMRTMLTRAGYTRSDIPSVPANGGFAESAPTTPAQAFCKGAKAAMFNVLDSAQAPLVVALQLLEGEAGQQSCSPSANRARIGSPPVTVPHLSTPRGVMALGGVSTHWGGSGGGMESTLRTTMPVDSLLANYSAQLVAGGWKAEGRSAITNGVGVQRFSFREGQEDWASALIIITVDDRREVLLRFTSAN